MPDKKSRRREERRTVEDRLDTIDRNVAAIADGLRSLRSSLDDDRHNVLVAVGEVRDGVAAVSAVVETRAEDTDRRIEDVRLGLAGSLHNLFKGQHEADVITRAHVEERAAMIRAEVAEVRAIVSPLVDQIAEAAATGRTIGKGIRESIGHARDAIRTDLGTLRNAVVSTLTAEETEAPLLPSPSPIVRRPVRTIRPSETDDGRLIADAAIAGDTAEVDRLLDKAGVDDTADREESQVVEAPDYDADLATASIARDLGENAAEAIARRNDAADVRERRRAFASALVDVMVSTPRAVMASIQTDDRDPEYHQTRIDRAGMDVYTVGRFPFYGSVARGDAPSLTPRYAGEAPAGWIGQSIELYGEETSTDAR